MEDDPASRKAQQFFETYFLGKRIDDLSALSRLLPHDPRELCALKARCFTEERKALHAGHHTEARRLGILARQLQKLADQNRANFVAGRHLDRA